MNSYWTLALLLLAFIYGLIVSWLASRESGQRWMLYLPHWIDRRSGVSSRLRRHGFTAFGLLFAATLLYFYQRA